MLSENVLLCSMYFLDYVGTLNLIASIPGSSILTLLESAIMLQTSTLEINA